MDREKRLFHIRGYWACIEKSFNEELNEHDKQMHELQSMNNELQLAKKDAEEKYQRLLQKYKELENRNIEESIHQEKLAAMEEYIEKLLSEKAKVEQDHDKAKHIIKKLIDGIRARNQSDPCCSCSPCCSNSSR